MPELSFKQWLIYNLIGVGMLFLVVFQISNIHQDLTVSVLDIGQGDAILIQTPNYHNILIDAGPDSKVVDELGDTISFFDKTIDIFLLTHPHRDHYGGVLDVMQKYEIKKVISNDPTYKAFLAEIRRSKIETVFIQNNQDIQIDSNLYLDILYPFAGQSLVGQDVYSKNNTSIVARLLRLSDNGWENLVILTGDAEMEEEREILLSGQNLNANILKVGHHGSRTATSDTFLSAVSPQTAVISVGEGNTFEHPHQETIEKLSSVKTMRTDELGTIKFAL